MRRSVVVNSNSIENTCLSLVEAPIGNICDLVWPSASSCYQFARLKSCLLECSCCWGQYFWEDWEGDLLSISGWRGQKCILIFKPPMAPFPKEFRLFALIISESFKWSCLKVETRDGGEKGSVKYLRLVIFDFTKIFESKRAPGSRSATLALARSRTYKNFFVLRDFRNSCRRTHPLPPPPTAQEILTTRSLLHRINSIVNV